MLASREWVAVHANIPLRYCHLFRFVQNSSVNISMAATCPMRFTHLNLLPEMTWVSTSDLTRHLNRLCGPQSYRYASHSSHSWLERQKKDVYKKMARYDNYRARSAYKLIQIDDKFKFLKPGKVVIEAGASPGSWTQVICERLGLTMHSELTDKLGVCIAVDIAAIEPVDGAICIGNADVTSPFTQASILTWLNDRKVDCVLSDMAPNCTGQKSYDHTKVVNLVKSILPFTLQVLSPGGVFLFKLWDGSEREGLIVNLKGHFSSVRVVKPEASRDDSAEIYILCQNFSRSRTSNQVGRDKDVEKQ